MERPARPDWVHVLDNEKYYVGDRTSGRLRLDQQNVQDLVGFLQNEGEKVKALMLECNVERGEAMRALAQYLQSNHQIGDVDLIGQLVSTSSATSTTTGGSNNNNGNDASLERDEDYSLLECLWRHIQCGDEQHHLTAALERNLSSIELSFCHWDFSHPSVQQHIRCILVRNTNLKGICIQRCKFGSSMNMSFLAEGCSAQRHLKWFVLANLCVRDSCFLAPILQASEHATPERLFLDVDLSKQAIQAITEFLLSPKCRLSTLMLKRATKDAFQDSEVTNRFCNALQQRVLFCIIKKEITQGSDCGNLVSVERLIARCNKRWELTRKALILCFRKQKLSPQLPRNRIAPLLLEKFASAEADALVCSSPTFLVVREILPNLIQGCASPSRKRPSESGSVDDICVAG